MLEEVSELTYSNLPLPKTGLPVDGAVVTPEIALNLLDNIITDERKTRVASVIDKRTNNFIPVVENVYDRGNINAVMRSAEAFGFYNFHIVEKDNAQYKAANRVTQGTHKWLDIKRHMSSLEAAQDLKSKGIKIYCTHLEASKPMSEIDFSNPTALVFGNERDGVSDEMLDLADGNCIIPMQGFAQSFNISVAAAISFYHVYSQRVAKLGKSGDLTDDEKTWLRANYYLKTFGDIEKFKKLFLKVNKN